MLDSTALAERTGGITHDSMHRIHSSYRFKSWFWICNKLRSYRLSVLRFTPIA